MDSKFQLRSRAELVNYVNHGNKVKYIFFWGHQKPKRGVSKTCFSQWYESPFKIEPNTYDTAEHYMMAEKAKLFNDNEAFEKVLSARNPGEAKKYGRNVLGFKKNYGYLIDSKLLLMEILRNSSKTKS